MQLTLHKLTSRALARLGALAVAAGVACEGTGAHVTAPRGAGAFARFEVIGGAFAAGAQSNGLVASSQATAWPALIAGAAGVAFAQPLRRAPGCPPPLVAPLVTAVRLSGTLISAVDSSCAVLQVPFTPPGNNLALVGASAWDALYLTPKRIAGAPPGTYGAANRASYQAALALTQSQVTAMLVQRPTLVALELGLGEVIRAASTGRVVVATAYGTPADWTLAPDAVATPLLDAIGDSVVASGAKAVVVSMPNVTRFPAFVRGSDVWAEASALQAFGIAVDGNCQASTNIVNVARLVPALAAAAATAGVPQPLSCADIPNAEDGILTDADVAAVDAAVDGINAHLQALASSHGWAFADLDAVYDAMAGGAGAYSASTQLTCTVPYGALVSLDGLTPSAAGQRRIADAVSAAINARYGFALPVIGDSLALQVPPCGAAATASAAEAPPAIAVGAAAITGDRFRNRSSIVRAIRLETNGGPRHDARGWLH